MSELRSRLAGWLERLVAKLDASYDACEICGKSGEIKMRGWYDEGGPMMTCAKCGAPEDEEAA